MIKELLFYVRAENLPLRFVVVGITEECTEKYESEDERLIITGEYEQKDAAKLLKAFDTSLVGILSLWEETYSYTASEAILSGYPVLTFSLGAQAERVQKYGCGWTLGSIAEMKNFLHYIVTANGRADIVKRGRLTRNFVNGA